MIRSHCMTGRLLAAALALLAGNATADEHETTTSATTLFAFGDTFTETDGADLYHHICQGCHMPQGQGAAGAGAYPALAKNPKLASRVYPAVMVVNGRRAMPPFGNELSDAQIAAVVNYVRTHFGNDYHDAITADEVKSVRPQQKPADSNPQ